VAKSALEPLGQGLVHPRAKDACDQAVKCLLSADEISI
jgi:hypothetical protein